MTASSRESQITRRGDPVTEPPAWLYASPQGRQVEVGGVQDTVDQEVELELTRFG